MYEVQILPHLVTQFCGSKLYLHYWYTVMWSTSSTHDSSVFHEPSTSHKLNNCEQHNSFIELLYSWFPVNLPIVASQFYHVGITYYKSAKENKHH